MEEEAYFLYIAHRISEKPYYYDEQGLEIRESSVVIKRATLRRPDKHSPAWEGFKFDRVHVDFDPTNKQYGFVVILRAKTTEGKSHIFKNNVVFLTVAETEEEAKNIAESTKEKGEYKSLLQKNYQLDEIVIEPILISQN